MNDAFQFPSRVGDNGILNVEINLGREEAGRDVVIAIAPRSTDVDASGGQDMPWHEFVERTYGSCAVLGLERHA